MFLFRNCSYLGEGQNYEKQSFGKISGQEKNRKNVKLFELLCNNSFKPFGYIDLIGTVGAGINKEGFEG